MKRLDVNRFNKLVKRLSTLGDEAEKGLDQILEGVSTEIALASRQRAPKDTGTLARSINASKTDDLTYQVEVGVDYGPYMEFGTGGLVSVPNELREIAIQFKGEGVKEIDLRPQPYLYPSFVEGRRQAINDAERLVNKLSQ